MLARRKSKKNSVHPAVRFIRSLVSVVALTALVLGITLAAKELYVTDSTRFGKISSQLLAKLHLSVDEQQVGEIAGKFAERISQTNLGSGVSSSRVEESGDISVHASKDALVEVAVMSDIHEDTANLEKALEKVKNRGIEHIFILGDLTRVGDVESLSAVKKVLDKTGLEYFVIPGDHDIAQSKSNENFLSVFGEDHGSVEILGYKFVYFSNAANFTKIDAGAISWFEKEIAETDFLFMSQPLYTEGLIPVLSGIYMGSTREPVIDSVKLEQQEAVRDQGVLMLSLIRGSKDVKGLIAGDHHMSSTLKDSERASLTHYVVGAITSQLNDEYSQKTWQPSRFSVLSIYQDGGYELEDVVLD